MPDVPTKNDLASVAAFADRFEGLDPSTIEWYRRPDAVVEWTEALYHHHIIDFESNYMSKSNVALVNRLIEDPSPIARMGLAKLRRVLTFLARADRHTEGGWYEKAFESGMAQAATRRLGKLAE